MLNLFIKKNKIIITILEMERGLPGRTLVFYPNFWTLHICLLPAMQSCHGRAMQCITTLHHHSAPPQCITTVHHHSASPQCITVPPIVMALCGGGNRSLPLVAAAFNPLLPSQTLTATEAFDISFNIPRANSTSIHLLQ